MEEKYSIDKENLLKQYYDEILKKGKYIEVKMIIESETNQCIPYIHIMKAGIKDVAFMIASLQKMQDKLKKEFPIAGLLSIMSKIETEDISGEGLKIDEEDNGGK